jgi:hypothetical protein
MPSPKFKQRCALCKKNWAEMYSNRQFPICPQCQIKQINQPIDDPEYKKFFDLPLELYERSSFLRSIKQSYLRFGSLTDKQKEAFVKVAEELKHGKKEEIKEKK